MSHFGLKRVAIMGEIGSGNLGDDFGYVLLRDELRQAFAELDVLVDIRPLTPNMFWILDSYHWDAVVTGVGTLLDFAEGPYVEALRRAAVTHSIAILGSGVSDVRHQPATPTGRTIFTDVLSSCKYVWLRGKVQDVDDSLVGPDPMWLYGWHGDGPPPSKVGINVGYAGFSTLNLDPAYLESLKVARTILRRPSVLLAAWQNDVQWLKQLKKPGEDTYLITGTRSSLSKLDECSAVLATRIHLGVIASCHGARAILPDYAGKVRAVFHKTSVPWVCLACEEEPVEIASALEQPPYPEAKAAVISVQADCRARVRAAAKAIMESW